MSMHAIFLLMSFLLKITKVREESEMPNRLYNDE